MEKQKLEKFRIESSQLTERAIVYYESIYGIDLKKCTTSDLKLLIDFFNYGASKAIMNKILEIRESQETPTLEEA